MNKISIHLFGASTNLDLLNKLHLNTSQKPLLWQSVLVGQKIQTEVGDLLIPKLNVRSFGCDWIIRLTGLWQKTII
jgi:hypothetical protein